MIFFSHKISLIFSDVSNRNGHKSTYGGGSYCSHDITVILDPFVVQGTGIVWQFTSYGRWRDKKTTLWFEAMIRMHLHLLFDSLCDVVYYAVLSICFWIWMCQKRKEVIYIACFILLVHSSCLLELLHGHCLKKYVYLNCWSSAKRNWDLWIHSRASDHPN